MTADSWPIIEQALLTPGDLSYHQVEQVLSKLLSAKIEFADIYMQSKQTQSLSLEDGCVKNSYFSLQQGMGVRACHQGQTALAYADRISAKALLHAAEATKTLAKHGDSQKIPVVCQAVSPISPYHSGNPLQMWTLPDQLDLLRAIDAHARGLDPKVCKVFASIHCDYELIMVMASDGTFATDIRPLLHCSIKVVVADGDRREDAHFGGGGRYMADKLYLADQGALKWTEEAVRQALLLLEARPAPAGPMPVVLGPGWPGVLLHEAVGHGLEGDFNRKKTSAFADKLGQQVASPGVTVIDDGTLPERRGSLTIDDEGTPTQRNVLIEDGKLVGYLQDKQNAKLMGMAPTGNGRRQSYSHMPMPRMTNTFMLSGQYDPQEIIASVDSGIYAVHFGGGSVDITSGQFVFSATEAYFIEKGKITHPVKGATLIGVGPEIMNQISMIGNDLALDSGVGNCGKDGQTVPVGVGQPTLKIDRMNVGGTELNA